MSRLTRKENVDYTTNAIIHTVGFVVSGDRNRDYNNALKKLYELENIEEQLGCPLEVVLKALKDGIFCENERGYTINIRVFLQFIEANGKYSLLDFNYDFILPLKDYKKTWWLREDKSE